jgi:hypothetical protein
MVTAHATHASAAVPRRPYARLMSDRSLACSALTRTYPTQPAGAVSARQRHAAMPPEPHGAGARDASATPVRAAPRVRCHA